MNIRLWDHFLGMTDAEQKERFRAALARGEKPPDAFEGLAPEKLPPGCAHDSACPVIACDVDRAVAWQKEQAEAGPSAVEAAPALQRGVRLHCDNGE